VYSSKASFGNCLAVAIDVADSATACLHYKLVSSFPEKTTKNIGQLELIDFLKDFRYKVIGFVKCFTIIKRKQNKWKH